MVKELKAKIIMGFHYQQQPTDRASFCRLLVRGYQLLSKNTQTKHLRGNKVNKNIQKIEQYILILLP